MLRLLVDWSLENRPLVLIAAVLIVAGGRLRPLPTAHRRRARHHERPGADPHQGPGAGPGGDGAVRHLPHRSGHERPAPAGGDPLHLALRALRGHGGVPGRGRRLLRPAARERAAHPGARIHPRGLRQPRDGPRLHRPRRGLHVHGRGRGCLRHGATHHPRLGHRPAPAGGARGDRGQRLGRLAQAVPGGGGPRPARGLRRVARATCSRRWSAAPATPAAGTSSTTASSTSSAARAWSSSLARPREGRDQGRCRRAPRSPSATWPTCARARCCASAPPPATARARP